MQILMILYRSGLGIDRVKELFRERIGKYRAVNGLLQKLYVHDPSTGHVGGIYIFDGAASMQAFRSSNLEKSIGETYRFTEPPTYRTFGVVQALHEEGGDAARESANAATFRRVVDEALNHGRLEVLDESFAPRYVEHQAGIAPAGLEGVKAFMTAARAAFPDLRVTVDATAEAGGLVWARSTARGTHLGPFMELPPTRRSFNLTVFDLCRFENGRVVEHWGAADRLALLQQLGAQVSPAAR